MKVCRTVKGTPLRRPLGEQPGARQHQLQVEQLVEREPAPTGLRLLDRGGPVHRAERLGQRRQAEVRPGSTSGSGSREKRDQRLEVPVDEAADHLVAQPLGGPIDRQHPARAPVRRPRPSASARMMNSRGVSWRPW